LHDGLNDLSNYFILPESTKNADPSWFGFLLTVKETAGFNRADIVKYLEDHNIQTRMLFAGNLTRHPCFDQMRKTGKGYRMIGDLKNTDRIMNDTFWIGVYPGMTEEQLNFMIQTIIKFSMKVANDK
jgi:CDP-6-deoxy-D-xylo-4-hexulose-3-dehydrase